MPMPIFRRLLRAAAAEARALRTDLRLAWVNLLVIVRYSPPQVVQLLFGLWPLLWGVNALRVGPSLWDTAPRLYAWMHTGVFAWATPLAWGLLMVGIAAFSCHALVWPSVRRAVRVRAAARTLCGLNAALALGFGCSVPGNPAWIGYAWLTVVFAWCLWRLADRD